MYHWGQTCIKPSVGNLWLSSATGNKTSAPRHDNRKEIHKKLGQLVENRKVTLCQPAATYCQGSCSAGCRLQNALPANPKTLIQDVDRQTPRMSPADIRQTNIQNVARGHPTDKKSLNDSNRPEQKLDSCACNIRFVESYVTTRGSDCCLTTTEIDVFAETLYLWNEVLRSHFMYGKRYSTIRQPKKFFPRTVHHRLFRIYQCVAFQYVFFKV